MKNRILVISWFYPPVNSSEGLVTYKLLKASKYEYDVFTQRNNALWSYGNKDNLSECKNVKSIFAKAKNLESWTKEAIEYYKKNQEKYDIIMTRSMPPESHKIGLEIKKINPNIKWIASFGDPIAENPYTKFTITYSSPYSIKNCAKFRGIISPKRIIRNTVFKIRYQRLHRKFKHQDVKFQENIINNANYIIFNSTYQKDYMLRNFKEEVHSKAIILNHSFDKTLYNGTSKEKQKIEMAYIGHLDNIRSPYILLSAIQELNEENPDLADKVQFSFYGKMADSDKLYIINNELTDIVKVKKPVSYMDSLKIMKESDWLLQIDANLSGILDKNIFFAAKLADYIGAGSKIFGITMLEGISADILRKLNAVMTSFSKEEIKNYLWLIIYNNYQVKLNEEFAKEFDSVEVAKKFDEMVSKL